MVRTWNDYYTDLHTTWWAWASEHGNGHLDGVARPGRPPVFSVEFADQNIIASNNANAAQRTRELIPHHQRHRGFASMRSSQALVQSVFGALVVARRLDLLEQVTADCGRPAFGKHLSDSEPTFEFEVDWLGEPRPTSIDVFFRSPSYCVAVECKFTERDFGQCSRPNLTAGDPAFETQYCDGRYTRQLGRASRCSLTDIGVAYWDHLTHLFEWDADINHTACPLRTTYQLARNAIAACSRPDHIADTSLGHVLVVYDHRNPEFKPGGIAHAQFAAASKAAVDEGLLRKVAWQTLAKTISVEPDFEWLLGGLRDRHGITVV